MADVYELLAALEQRTPFLELPVRAWAPSRPDSTVWLIHSDTVSLGIGDDVAVALDDAAIVDLRQMLEQAGDRMRHALADGLDEYANQLARAEALAAQVK